MADAANAAIEGLADLDKIILDPIQDAVREVNKQFQNAYSVVASSLSAIGNSIGDAIVAGAQDLYKLSKEAIRQISQFNPMPLFDGLVMAVTFITGQVC